MSRPGLILSRTSACAVLGKRNGAVKTTPVRFSMTCTFLKAYMFG